MTTGRAGQTDTVWSSIKIPDKAGIETPSKTALQGDTQGAEVVAPDTAGINESVHHHQGEDGIIVTDVETTGKAVTRSEFGGALSSDLSSRRVWDEWYDHPCGVLASGGMQRPFAMIPNSASVFQSPNPSIVARTLPILVVLSEIASTGTLSHVTSNSSPCSRSL